jgi:putative spermidine/putrescine transport system permease protein
VVGTRDRALPLVSAPWHRRLDLSLLLLVPAVVLAILLFIGPFVYGLSLSFQPYGNDQSVTASYAKFLLTARGQLAIWNSLRLAFPATAIDVLVALPLAYRLRHPLPGARLIVTVLVVPMALGSVLIAEGMLQFFGPAGWANKVLLALHLTSSPVQFVHNYAGVLISLVISDFPVVFMVLAGYASGIDPNLERAARILGAGFWRRTWRITLPLMTPGLSAAVSLSFVTTFSVFPTAVMVGQPAGETYVVALAAWQAAYEHYDYSEASAIAIVMAAIMLLFIGIVFSLRGRLNRAPTGGS